MLICGLVDPQNCDGKMNVVSMVLERVKVVSQLQTLQLRLRHRGVVGM
jgi:hypothetical protein